MRKRIYGKKLGRGYGARRALIRSQIRSLVENGAIKTTKAKAKAVSSDVDKIMRLVARDDVSSRRLVLARLGNDKVTMKKLFGDYMDHAKARKSGFTRIVILPNRKGDDAPMARLEWIEIAKKENENVSTKKKSDK